MTRLESEEIEKKRRIAGNYYISPISRVFGPVEIVNGLHIAMEWTVIVCLAGLVIFIPWSIFHG